MPLTFRHKLRQQSNTVTPFDTFRSVGDNIFKLCNIPRRHGEIIMGAEELGGGEVARASQRGVPKRRLLPAILLMV
jgi:hypothetical protein